MSVITLFSGVFCREDKVVQDLVSETGYSVCTDSDIAARACKISDFSHEKIERAFYAKTSVFNKFTHEKESSIAYIRLALAEKLLDDDLILTGFAGQLIPKEVNHVLKVCLIGGMKFRISEAMELSDLSEKEALKSIRKNDDNMAAWINSLFGKNDPWDSSLYDIVVPMDKKNVEEVSSLISGYLSRDAVRTDPDSKEAVEDMILAARSGVELANEGHSVDVAAKRGVVTLTINKHVLMLGRLEAELKSIVEKVPGVSSVETKVGKGFHQADVYRKHDFQVPSRVLLVDDEREYVQTLSDRLMMRDMGSAVTYDGESALDMINEDEPDVMLLDLKMPGIDGFEVLRRVKETHPNIEVIILTGKGSVEDRDNCIKLGAFAYLEKPLDIDLLSDTIKKANEKIQRNEEKQTKS